MRVLDIAIAAGAGILVGALLMWSVQTHPGDLEATRTMYEARQAALEQMAERYQQDAIRARENADAQHARAEEASARAETLADQVAPSPDPPPMPPPETVVLERTPPAVVARLTYWEQVFAPQARKRMNGLAIALAEQERAINYWRDAHRASVLAADRWRAAHSAAEDRAAAAEERVKEYDRVVLTRRSAWAMGLAAVVVLVLATR